MKVTAWPKSDVSVLPVDKWDTMYEPVLILTPSPQNVESHGQGTASLVLVRNAERKDTTSKPVQKSIRKGQHDERSGKNLQEKMAIGCAVLVGLLGITHELVRS